MGKLWLALFFGGVLCAAGAGLIVPSGVGTTWEYEVRGLADKRSQVSTLVVRISGTEQIGKDELLRFETVVDGALTKTELMSVDRRGLLCYRRVAAGEKAISFDPPQAIVPSPLALGTRWEVDDVALLDRRHRQFKVVGEEQIAVPAGSFRAVHIQCEDPWPLSNKTERWIVPGIGLVKEIDTTRGPNGRLMSRVTMVLTKFSPAPSLVAAKGDAPERPSAEISITPTPTPTPTPGPQIDLQLAATRDGPALTDFRSDVPNIFVRWSGQNLPVEESVRIAWIAEDVGELAPPNFVVDEVERTVASSAFGGRFTLSRPRDGWAPGKYRAELYLADQLLATVHVAIHD